MGISRQPVGFTSRIRSMKTKILGLVLISAGLMSCGSVTIDFGGPADLKGNVLLPSGVKSQQLDEVSMQQILGQGVANDALAIEGEFIVKFNTSAGSQTLAKQGVAFRPMVAADNESTWAVVKTPSLEAARQIPGVVYAQPNYRYTKLAVPNDPLAQPTVAGDTNRQWYLSPIKAYEAWNRLPEFNTVVKVAVIDDGYRPHADMPASFFDLSNPECNTSTGQYCLDVVDYDSNPAYEATDATFSHGMAVAGVIGAATNNGVGMAGLGYNKVRVIPIKITTVDTNNDVSTSEGISNAFNTAIRKNARVINFSFCLTGANPNVDPCAYTADPAVEATLKNAFDKDITVVVAAGNSGKGTVAYPASSPYVLSVGATNERNNRASFSNYGAGLDLVAPGTEIRTLGIGQTGANNLYMEENGTSFSAPIVSGAAALLYSRNPNLTVEEVRSRLISSGDVPSDPTIANARFLRIDRALNADTMKLMGRVWVAKNGQVVKSMAWTDFATNQGSLPYSFQDVPSGSITIEAQVAEKGFPNNLLYKCVKTFNLSGDQTRNLTVGNPSNPPQCF